MSRRYDDGERTASDASQRNFSQSSKGGVSHMLLAATFPMRLCAAAVGVLAGCGMIALQPTLARGAGGWDVAVIHRPVGPGASSAVPPPVEIDDVDAHGDVAKPDRRLQLEVFINGVSTGLIGSFVEVAGALACEIDEIKEIGLKAEARAVGRDGLVRLDRLTHVTYRVDEATQRLLVTADENSRERKVIDVSRRRAAALAEPRSDYGALVNYALFASSNGFDSGFGDWFHGVSGDFEARLFSPYGTLSQTFLAGYSNDHLDGMTRLQTTWSYSDPRRLLTYRAGDLITSGLSWTRPVYLGGAQVERNFGLRRDLVTVPLPSFSGTAAVPSTVEVYSRGLRTYSGQIADGPFELTNLASGAGANSARVVLRDSMGRETIADLPFFVSNKMLAPGLMDFALEAGLARRSFGLEDFDYDERAFGFATARYGLTNWLTVEGHAEGGESLLNGGVGVTFPLAYYGVASLAGAGSWNDGNAGGLVNASIELVRRRWSAYGRVQYTFGAYRDVASVTSHPAVEGVGPLTPGFFDTDVPTALYQIGLSAPLFNLSNIGLSFTQIEEADGDRARFLTLSYSQPVWDTASLYTSALLDVGGGGRFGIQAGLSMSLGDRVGASSWIQHGAEGTQAVAEASRSARAIDGDYGWRVRASEGSAAYQSASGTYRSSWAQFEGGVQRYGNDTRATARMSGSVVAMPAGVFVANRIDDSFAVVDVGFPGVEVQLQNRTVGKTDSNGTKLVTGLTSFEGNAISIDPRSFPIDADIPRTREVVVPAQKSGVVIDFDVRTASAAALVALVDTRGKPLDVGLVARLDGRKEEFVVGYDGQIYLSGLSARNTLSVQGKDGPACRATFDYETAKGTQVLLQGIVCR